MRLAVSTIILAMAASTAIAMIGSDRKTNGTMIPLTKRQSSWLKPDNSVDFDVLRSHVESVDAKILRGLQNYERNMGMSHPLAVKGTELLNLKKRAVGTVALTSPVSRRSLFWYGTITIGTPPKSFTVLFDTGMSGFYLPGPTCSGCSGHTLWDPASSSTAQDMGSTFEINFEDGASVAGKRYTDNVTIGGLSADIQTVGAATTYSATIGFPPDGSVGMAFQSISDSSPRPLFATLVDEGKVTEPVFSFKFTSHGGELYLGGTNRDLYAGNIIYTPVIVEGYWQVNLKAMIIDRVPILENIVAMIDTGATVIVGDEEQVDYLHQTYGGKSVGRGWYSFPCNDFPSISFNFGGGRTFEIPASILNLGPVRTGSALCFSGIVAEGEREYWILGGIFLQNVYTVFDFGNKQVGFANLV